MLLLAVVSGSVLGFCAWSDAAHSNADLLGMRTSIVGGVRWDGTSHDGAGSHGSPFGLFGGW